MKWSLLAALWITVFAGQLVAQDVPPALFIAGDGGKQEPLGLTEVDIDVRIHGHLAKTRMTMTFYNPHHRVLAGDLYFPLPEGSTVSGYALDIDGRMVDGVVVERNKGRQVLEKIVRQGIDPGLVEWVKGNNFKTRVYPIPVRGSRTIRVEYTSELNHSSAGLSYLLPLAFKDRVGQLSLRVEVVDDHIQPRVAQGAPRGFHFDKWRGGYVAEARLQGATLSENLIVQLPDTRPVGVVVEKADDGNYYYAISETPPPLGAENPDAPERVTIYWDASGSRGEVSHGRELALIEKIFGGWWRRAVAVELVIFRHRAEPPRRFTIIDGRADKLIAALKDVAYDGGTSLGSISPGGAAGQADLSLLFTDGLSNFATEDPGGFEQPLYVFTADSRANHPFLRYLARGTGGDYLNLMRLEDPAVLDGIGRRGLTFRAAGASGGGDAEIFPRTPTPVQGRLLVAGKLVGKSEEVTIQYGVGEQATRRSVVKVSSADAVDGNLLRNFWAQKKLAELIVFPRKNKQEIASLGKRFGLVTPGTSLLVLDNLEQYVEHEVPPPRSLPEMRTEYKRRIAARDKRQRRDRKDKIGEALAMWKRRVNWWRTDFKRSKKKKAEVARESEGGTAEGTLSLGGLATGHGGGGGSGSGYGRGAELMARRAPAVSAMMVEDQEAVVEKARIRAGSASVQDGAASEPAVISIEPWDPQTPYLAALKRAASGDRWRIYLAQRADHKDAPSFFLDCAQFFYDQKQDDRALQVLSNIAEIELENPALSRVLAHRLAQQDLFDLAIPIFEEVLRIRPEEPQSYRDLALVLSRRAETRRSFAAKDFARAIELLYEIVLREWDRFDEIEVVALMEINRLIPRAQRAGLSKIPVDPRFIKKLDMDLRIVLTWDADMTDMDLWVTEPTREKADYSNPRTAIGGNVSRDFTQGYGPEEYCLKKAPKGAFKIQSNYYGSSAQRLIGAVTLQVEIFTDYGRPTEKRRSITRRLTHAKDTIDIGAIDI